MAKINIYKCDVCGADIKAKRREIPMGDTGKMVPCSNESIMRLEIKQIDTLSNYPERTIEIDLCNDHYNMIKELLEKEKIV